MTATVFAAPAAVTADAAIAVAVLMVALWLISIPLRDVSIVDPAWGPAFVLVALVAALTGGGCLGRRWLLLGLTALWGLRLGAYLLARKRRDPGRIAATPRCASGGAARSCRGAWGRSSACRACWW